MKTIRQSYEIIKLLHNNLEIIELAGRNCYQSEPKGDAEKFVQKINKLGHHSVLEHSFLMVKFTTDRAVMAQLTRHRLAAYSIESQRYCNYDGGITFIIPTEFVAIPEQAFIGVFPSFISREEHYWLAAMDFAEFTYKELLRNNCSPQLARSVLPNATKTEIVMSANFREWKHIFNLRCSHKAQPQIRDLLTGLKNEMITTFPSIFA